MRIKTLIDRLRPRVKTRPTTADWMDGLSLRDLADLPTHHPRHSEN